MNKINLYKIDKSYLDHLRKYDSRVPNANYHLNNRNEKLYLGILLRIGEYDYFAPLSHQISNPQSSFLIKDNAEYDYKAYASIRLKFMVPIFRCTNSKNIFTIKDIESVEDKDYRELLSQELQYCRVHYSSILEQTKIVYDKRINNKSGFQHFCCNFKKLENISYYYFE